MNLIRLNNISVNKMSVAFQKIKPLIYDIMPSCFFYQLQRLMTGEGDKKVPKE